jgi:hypothetical protein
MRLENEEQAELTSPQVTENTSLLLANFPNDCVLNAALESLRFAEQLRSLRNRTRSPKIKAVIQRVEINWQIQENFLSNLLSR